MKQHIKTLEQHNAWRRGADVPEVNPTYLGIAIDEVLMAAKRYEEVRLWSTPAFIDVCAESIKTGASFDSLIDSEIAKREGK